LRPKRGSILGVYVRGDLGEVQSPYGRGIGTEAPGGWVYQLCIACRPRPIFVFPLTWCLMKWPRFVNIA